MESINFENTIKPEEIEQLKIFTEKFDEEDSNTKTFSCIKKDDSDDLEQILYQEKYRIDNENGEYYLLERTYYDKNNPDSEKPVYKEIFEPNQEDYLDGDYVSRIRDSNDNFIGYRYYSNKQTDKSELVKKYEEDNDGIEVIYLDSSNNKIDINPNENSDNSIIDYDIDDSSIITIDEKMGYFTIIRNEEGIYKIVDKDTDTDQCRQIMRNLYRNMFESSEPYEITGNNILTRGYISAIAAENKNDNVIIAENLEETLNELNYDNPITYFNAYGDDYTITVSDLAFDIFPSSYNDRLNGKIGLIPFNSPRHTTGIFTEFKYLEDKYQYLTIDNARLIDTSHADCPGGKNNPNINEKLFGKFDIKLVNTDKAPQLNGTCTQQISCIFDAIVSQPEKYKNKDNISEAIRNGSLFLDAYVIMSEIFDQRGNETIVHFTDENEARSEININKDFVFKLNDEYYGINKNFSKNRFVNIEALEISESLCLNEEGKKLSEIDSFNKECEKQKQIIEIDEKIHSINEIYEKEKNDFVTAHTAELSDKNDLVLEEWRNILKERDFLEIEEAIALINNSNTNEISLKIRKKDEEINNKNKEYNKNDLELIKARQEAEKQFDSMFKEANQGKSFRNVIHENRGEIFSPCGVIDAQKSLTNIIGLPKFCRGSWIREKSKTEKIVEGFLTSVKSTPKVPINSNLADKIKIEKQKAQQLDLNFSKKLSELERTINSLYHINTNRPYCGCLLEYYKTKAELEKEKNKTDDDRDRLKMTFYEKKINLLEKRLIGFEYNRLVEKMSYCFRNEIKLEKTDINRRLEIENSYQSITVKDTQNRINLEIELLGYDYNIYDELIKIRDLSKAGNTQNKEEINRHRQYLYNNRKLYSELKKKFRENHISQATIINSNSNLQQKRYELAKMKHQQRMLSIKKEKLTNLVQNKAKKSPQPFTEKHNLKRSCSQPNLSFLEKEKLKKQKGTITQLPTFK